MKAETVFEYLGDRDDGYVKGHEYALTVMVRPTMWRILQFILQGVPYKYKIVILKPIPLAYPSWDDFNGHWKLKYTRFSDGDDQ